LKKERPPQRRPLDQNQRNQSRLPTIAIDDDALPVMVHIPVVVALLDHDGIVAVPMVTIPDHVTITIAIPITVAGSDGNAGRTDTYANFFRASRHGTANSGYCDGYYCKTLDHWLLLKM
jgi:hypothetical protein